MRILLAATMILGSGARGKVAGVSLRGCASSLNRPSKLLALLSRSVRKFLSPKIALSVASTDVCWYCVESTLPAITHGEAITAGNTNTEAVEGKYGSVGWIARLRRFFSVGVGNVFRRRHMIIEAAMFVISYN